MVPGRTPSQAVPSMLDSGSCTGESDGIRRHLQPYTVFTIISSEHHIFLGLYAVNDVYEASLIALFGASMDKM